MAVRGVHTNRIDADRDQRTDPFEQIRSYTDRRADDEPTEFVLAGVRVIGHFRNITERNQTDKFLFGIDDGQFFDFFCL